MAVNQSFLTLTAGDVMSRAVVAIPQDMDPRGAARLLAREQISGAPVIDPEGHCVGVLSAADFINWAKEGGQPPPRSCPGPACVCADWQVVDADVELLPVDNVQRYMTPDPVMVPTGTSLTRIARMMMDAHIHRVLVTDGQLRPIGVVSSMDILAAVANAPGWAGE